MLANQGLGKVYEFVTVFVITHTTSSVKSCVKKYDENGHGWINSVKKLCCNILQRHVVNHMLI